MRLELRHPMQIEARLDLVQPPLQPFRIGAVDPGEALEGRQARWGVEPLPNPYRPDLSGRQRRLLEGRPFAI